MEGAARIAKDHDLLIQTHIAENPAEGEAVLAAHPWGGDYLGIYEKVGLLGPRTLLAHAIHLSASEWDRAAELGVSIAHCPDSNFFLGSGRMRLHEAESRGVAVGLGSDVAAGRSFDLRRAMAHAYDNALALGVSVAPARLLRLATLGGAAALGLAAETGSLEAGKSADFIAVSLPSTSTARGRSSRSSPLATAAASSGCSCAGSACSPRSRSSPRGRSHLVDDRSAHVLERLAGHLHPAQRGVVEAHLGGPGRAHRGVGPRQHRDVIGDARVEALHHRLRGRDQRRLTDGARSRRGVDPREPRPRLGQLEQRDPRLPHLRRHLAIEEIVLGGAPQLGAARERRATPPPSSVEAASSACAIGSSASISSGRATRTAATITATARSPSAAGGEAAHERGGEGARADRAEEMEPARPGGSNAAGALGEAEPGERRACEGRGERRERSEGEGAEGAAGDRQRALRPDAARAKSTARPTRSSAPRTGSSRAESGARPKRARLRRENDPAHGPSKDLTGHVPCVLLERPLRRDAPSALLGGAAAKVRLVSS